MKKNNKKGFTLIELVIVATIMVMIMGAILNWIRPMNKFYQRTQAIADSNDVGSLLMDYVDDELRYATDIVILQNYDGVPKLSNGFLMDSSGNASSSVQFTDVLILDSNRNVVRGSRFADYVANSTPARRKGAYGCIIKADARDFIDTGKMKCLGTEPLYNEYGCTFQASLSTLENGSSSVTIDMELSRPRRDGAEYKFDKFGYKQKRDFELVNVNLKSNKAMKAEFYTSSGEGNAIDYGKFAKASDPGSNPNASPMYGGGSDNIFTYILYTKKVPKEDQVTITLYTEPGSSIKAASPEKITAGYSIPENIYNNWKAIGESQTETSYSYVGGKYKRKTFVKIVDEENQDIDIYLDKGIMSDKKFFIITTYEERNDPDYKLTFYDRFDGGGNEHDPTTEPEITMKTAGIWDDQHIVEYNEVGNCDSKGEYQFVGWLNKDFYDPSAYPGPNPEDPADSMARGWFVSGQEYSNDATYYAVYKKNPSVTFQFEAADPSEVPSDFSVGDTVVVIDNFDASGYQNDSEMTYRKQQFADAFANIDSGRTFSHWTFVGSDGSEKDISEINKDTDLTENGVYTIKAYSKDNSYPDAYEVTIVIDKIPEETWYRVISFSANPGARWLITNEDGTQTYSSNEPNEPVISSWCQPPVTFTDGMVLKLYVFDDENQNVDIQIGWYNPARKITVHNDCTLRYNDGWVS